VIPLRAPNGWEFEVQKITSALDVSEMEAPFRLVRINGRPPFKGRAYRLVKNSHDASLCFIIPEQGDERTPDLWFRVEANGEVRVAK
jgi:hypothetical protein